jgi:hypothetical protein
VRHVRPSPTILDCPQLSWPTLVCKCVPWEVHAPNVRHVRTIPNYPGLSPQLSWAHLWCKCVPWMVHAPNVRHVRPPTILDLNYPGPPWCKCVPWMVHAPNVRHVRPSPTILDCPQLSWPTFVLMCSLGGTCTECETCETIPNYPGLSSTILAHLWV